MSRTGRSFTPGSAILAILTFHARLLFQADVFWARASIGNEMLNLWLETYQTTRDFRKRGIVELEIR
jgi:hypothetical protein